MKKINTQLSVTPLLRSVIQQLGSDHQIDKAIEECAELIDALIKYRHGRVQADAVITEVADVSILIQQLALIFGAEAFIAERQKKLLRLQQRLKNNKL